MKNNITKMQTKHKIITGDSRSMRELSDKSVHLIITSPPYWQLKDYGSDNQIGFNYMGAVIWQKTTTMNTTGGATIMGSFPYPRNGILKLDYEFILIFKKQGQSLKVDRGLKEKSKLTKEEWNEYFQGHWNFAGARQGGHIAIFPEELPKRLIKMFSFVGDTILDPFLGSGTTSLVAKNFDRNSIGYEINPNFISNIKNKIGKNYSNAVFEYIKQDFAKNNFSEKINNLPYLFKDTHKLDKKIDIKKLQFGSKIDGGRAVKRENFYTVKEIISPEKIKLNNNLIVRLLGIKQNPEINGKAVDFLTNKIKGQKVFMRFDNLKYDKQNNLLCYLYLQNKTFVNAHLIKSGYTIVNNEMDYRYKEKFNDLLTNYNSLS